MSPNMEVTWVKRKISGFRIKYGQKLHFWPKEGSPLLATLLLKMQSCGAGYLMVAALCYGSLADDQ